MLDVLTFANLPRPSFFLDHADLYPVIATGPWGMYLPKSRTWSVSGALHLHFDFLPSSVRYDPIAPQLSTKHEGEAGAVNMLMASPAIEMLGPGAYLCLDLALRTWWLYFGTRFSYRLAV